MVRLLCNYQVLALLLVAMAILSCTPLSINAQELKDRDWIQVETTQLWEVIDVDKLQNPLSLRVFRDQILVSDHGDMRLKRFSIDGSFLNSIGDGIGQAPGEVQILFDYMIYGGEAFIVDERGSRIHRYEKNGNYLESYITSPQHQRIATLEDKLVLSSIYKSEPFTVFDTDGQEIMEFGRALRERVSNPPALDGRFVQYEDGVIYLPFYAGQIHVFDEHGEHIREIKTVDGFDFLESGSHSRGFSSPDWDVRNNEGSIDGDHLYIRVRARTDDGMISILDRYSWPEGEYLDSFQLPNHFSRVKVSGGVMYVINRNEATLSAYEFEW